MAGWIRAIRAVPWGEVIAAAPLVVGSAKKILSTLRRKEETARATARAEPAELLSDDAALRSLQLRIADLEKDLIGATEILENLADQHAQLVIAVEALRTRIRTLTWTCVALAVLTSGLVLWLFMR